MQDMEYLMSMHPAEVKASTVCVGGMRPDGIQKQSDIR